MMLPRLCEAALAIASILFVLNQVEAQATCFFPDGTVASAFTPCAGNSGACCYNIDDAHHDLCYDNGFCYSLFFGYVYRGACTDSSWNTNSDCATECININTGGSGLATHCKDDTGTDYMCCGEATPDSNCCNDSSATNFLWSNASIINLPVKVETVIGSASNAGGSEATNAITVTVTALASNTATANKCSPNQTSGSTTQIGCKNTEIALGAGLGVPLGIFAIATAIFAAAYFKTLGRAKQASMPNNGYNGYQNHHYYIDPNQVTTPPTELPAGRTQKVELPISHRLSGS